MADQAELARRAHSHPGYWGSHKKLGSLSKSSEKALGVDKPLNELVGDARWSDIRKRLRRQQSVSSAGASRRGMLAHSSRDLEVPKESEEDEEARLQAEIDKLPAWRQTITVRALVTSIILGAVFSIISLRLGLTSGVIPSLNIGAGLLGFFSISSWSKFTAWMKMAGLPFTPQENTVIQTCVVAAYGMAFNGGFGTYLIAMDQQSYENVGDIPGNNPEDVYNPTLGRNIAYMFSIALFGVFMLVQLRKLFILDYKLPYPSGTATGLMINSFFTEDGSAVAQKQIRSMGFWGAFSFLFDLFKWFFSGTGDCGTITGGLGSWPTLGMKAANWSWYFDFSQNYIGAGMICPQIVSWSMMFGSILSWGIMWPLISEKEGDWYPAGLSSTSFEGLYGYKVFISIAVFLGDGGYILVKLILLSILSLRDRRAAAKAEADTAAAAGTQLGNRDTAAGGAAEPTAAAVDEEEDEEFDPFLVELRRRVFLGGSIPVWIGVAGYLGMLAVAVGVIPQLYPPAKWYMVLVAGLVAPPLAFANAYGAGMTDWNMASLYGKLAIFIFAAWAGANNQGVIAGLAVCGVVLASTGSASDLMQDFRTGYLTLSSPRAMFVAQVVGAAIGCIVAPLCFELFWSAFDIGLPGSLYFAPFGTVYRGMAIIGTEGFSALPEHCMQLCIGFFFIAIALNLLRDFLPKKYGKFVPNPMAMALPFYLGAWLAIDMCVGATIMLYWEWKNKAECDMLSAAVASGLIAGDGIWSIPSAILAIAGVNPPICMGWSKAS